MEPAVQTPRDRTGPLLPAVGKNCKEGPEPICVFPVDDESTAGSHNAAQLWSEVSTTQEIRNDEAAQYDSGNVAVSVTGCEPFSVEASIPLASRQGNNSPEASREHRFKYGRNKHAPRR